jgi:hypothetical protein
MVRSARLELARERSHQALDLARLPLRHDRIWYRARGSNPAASVCRTEGLTRDRARRTSLSVLPARIELATRASDARMISVSTRERDRYWSAILIDGDFGYGAESVIQLLDERIIVGNDVEAGAVDGTNGDPGLQLPPTITAKDAINDLVDS